MSIEGWRQLMQRTGERLANCKGCQTRRVTLAKHIKKMEEFVTRRNEAMRKITGKDYKS